MMKISKKISRTGFASIIVAVTLVCTLNVRDIFRWVGLRISGLQMPYGGSILDNLLAMLLVVLIAFVSLPRKQRQMINALGLQWNVFNGPALTLVATVPCRIGFVVQEN